MLWSRFRPTLLAAKSSRAFPRQKTVPRITNRMSVTMAKAVDELPENARKWVGRWLMACSGMAFGTVVVGGVTRLTKSGLSIVDWHPFKEFPPFSQTQWESEFSKYQMYPEYKLKNNEMSLEEFKKIWYIEYLHRMLGRTIGALFLFPAGYFWYKNWFAKPMKLRVVAFGSLLLFQGFLGWYMVKSGLEEETAERYPEPRVSHYRLAAHLGTAFAFYSLLFWTALSHLYPPQTVPVTRKMINFRRLVQGSKALVFFTALSGAFVAGIDAGLVYNSFPLMAGRVIPSDILALTPKWRNFTENPTTVQFDHRLLGLITFSSIVGCWVYSLKLPLPPRMRLAVNCLMGVAIGQVALGICTLLLYVPKPLAASHQAGALTLLSVALWLGHELRLVRYIPK